MGIDVYLEWDNMTEEDTSNQMTAFSVVNGHAGYLREAYHGGQYATHILVREAFESEDGQCGQFWPNNWGACDTSFFELVSTHAGTT